MANIVLDKCFLQGSSAIAIRELALSNRLLVSDGLFYELLSGSEPGRSRCFAKFPEGENPVDLVSHIGTLANIEINTHRRSGPPSENKEPIRFQFNTSLTSPGFKMPSQAKEAIDELFVQLREDSQGILDLAPSCADFFPGILSGSDQKRRMKWLDAERLIALPGSLIPFLETLKADLSLPPVEAMDETWAIYRHLQVKMLFALELHFTHQGKTPSLSPTGWTRLEHDVLDAQVLSLGCLEGAFATRETKLIRWFKLLCPDGKLFE
jgi:hypothetical protein